MRLDEMLINLPFPKAPVEEAKECDPSKPTAVLMVTGYNGLGIHSIFSIRKLFKEKFRNFIFISVGRVDSSKFKGREELENHKKATEEDLRKYVDLARGMGYNSEYRLEMGTDVIDEIEKICDQVAATFTEPIFFAGKLIFAQENPVTRVLHNQTSLELQRRLLFKGHNTVVLPIRVL